MNNELKSALKSFLDRLIEHSQTCVIPAELYEGDADTLRDAIAYVDHNERQAIAQTAPAVAGEAWLPIEDAPHGKTILLTCKYASGKPYVCIGHYIKKFTEESHNDNDNCEYNELDDTYYIQEGWYEHQYNWDEYSSIAISDKIIGWKHAPEPMAAPSQGAKQND